MPGKETTKVTRAKELLKDKRLTNKQIAMRCGTSSSYVSRLRKQMEAEQCK